MVFPGLEVSPFFPPNLMMTITAKQFLFRFTRPQYTYFMSPKMKAFFHVGICKQSDFLYIFWSYNFLLSVWPFSPCWYRICLNVDNDAVLAASASISTRCLSFILGLIEDFGQNYFNLWDTEPVFFMSARTDPHEEHKWNLEADLKVYRRLCRWLEPQGGLSVKVLPVDQLRKR